VDRGRREDGVDVAAVGTERHPIAADRVQVGEHGRPTREAVAAGTGVEHVARHPENSADFLSRQPSLLGELGVIELHRQGFERTLALDHQQAALFHLVSQALDHALAGHLRATFGHPEDASRKPSAGLKELERMLDELVAEAEHTAGLADGREADQAVDGQALDVHDIGLGEELLAAGRRGKAPPDPATLQLGAHPVGEE
jgi:hypothetical protein